MTPRSTNSESRILTVPNLLSLFRLCLIPLCVWLYCVRKNTLLTTLTLALSGLTDVADGLIARHFHMVSNVGKVLDPIADKLTQGAMLLCLLTRYFHMLLPVLLMAVKELFTGLGGLLVLRKTGQVFGARWHGKLATVLLYLMVIVHLLWGGIPAPASDGLIGLCSAAIILSFVLYGAQNLRLLAGGPKHA